MNIRDQLLIAHSKANTIKIVTFIGTDQIKLQALMNCFFSDEYRVNQRSAMAVSAFFDTQPKLMQPYIYQFIENLQNENLHIAIKRNTLRILQFVEIPEDCTSLLFDFCLDKVISNKEPIAVKAFAMGILGNVCIKYPELKAEVVPVLEEVLQKNESTGVNARCRNILAKLAKN